MKKHHHLLSFIIAGVVIVGGIVLLARITLYRPAPTSTPINKIEDVSISQFPREFPRDIPIEEGAPIVSNFNATSPEGHFQATRVFASQKTVTENFKLYKNWLAKNKWQILSESNDAGQSGTAILVARNTKGNLSVNISKSLTGAVSVVDISFVIPKEPASGYNEEE